MHKDKWPLSMKLLLLPCALAQWSIEAWQWYTATWRRVVIIGVFVLIQTITTIGVIRGCSTTNKDVWSEYTYGYRCCGEDDMAAYRYYSNALSVTPNREFRMMTNEHHRFMYFFGLNIALALLLLCWTTGALDKK